RPDLHRLRSHADPPGGPPAVHRRVPDPLGPPDGRRRPRRRPGDHRVPARPEAPRGRPRRRCRQGLTPAISDARKGHVSTVKIDQIDYQLSRIRLPKGDWGDQIHHVTHIEIITADIRTDTGVVGTGFTHTSGVGGRTILAMLEEMRPFLLGQPVNPRAVWHDTWRYIRDNGPGGVTTLALAAIDIALWDIVGKQRNQSLADVLGRVREDVPLYGSGINLNLSADEVVEQVKEWKGTGYFAGKVKVGKPDLEEDVYRLTKIREAVGEYPLMVDANQGWTYPEAVRAMERFRHLNLFWVEEPLPVDDVLGHARLRARSSLPIGLGENVYTLNQFNQYLSSDACDFVQADVGRVGGITPYLDIAAVARAF